MSFTTPPPPPPNQPPNQPFAQPPAAPTVKPPAIGWLIPVAGLLALIGVFTPWFSPEGRYKGQLALKAESDLYSWKDGKIGLIAPILLVLLGVAVARLMAGQKISRFEHATRSPVVTAARSALIAGAVSLAAVVIAWFLVPSQYDDIPSDAGGSWDGAERLGVDMSRGPQIGYWLTIAAAVIALVGGLLMLAMRDKAAEQKAAAAQAAFVPPPPAPNTAFQPAPMLNQPGPNQQAPVPQPGHQPGYPPAPEQNAPVTPPHP